MFEKRCLKKNFNKFLFIIWKKSKENNGPWSTNNRGMTHTYYMHYIHSIAPVDRVSPRCLYMTIAPNKNETDYPSQLL